MNSDSPNIKVEIEVKTKLLNLAMGKIEERLKCRAFLEDMSRSRNSISTRRFYALVEAKMISVGWSYIKISKVDNLIERCNMYKRIDKV